MTSIQAAEITRQLADWARDIALEVVAETGSTNADLMARSATLTQPVFRLALSQTAGRGRAGRSWISAGAEVLTFSLAWHFSDVQQLTGLPLAIGVSIAELLGELAIPVQLKWPNDILRDGKKLSGILIESSPASDGGAWVVIGVGINLLIPENVEQEIGRAVADAPWLAKMDRNLLIAKLINALSASLYSFAQHGFGAYQARWNTLHAYAGQAVHILDQGKVQQHGIAQGVDSSGRLILQTASGEIAILAGDVSLRLDQEL